MDWNIKKRGRVTYYTKKTNELFSDLVVEELENGDKKIYFVGMTGALAATSGNSSKYTVKRTGNPLSGILRFQYSA